MNVARFWAALLACLLSGCATLFSGQQAPDSCGFADGTALSYAGRSTTAALDVQEVVGDPMSNDPADIYITRDKFDQGELHGRLVCAVYVDQPGFVEITVHPADGGRFEPPEPVEPAPAPTDGISKNEALDIAYDAVPEMDGRDVVAEAGAVAHVVPGWESYEWLRDLNPDRWVWRVFLVNGDRGAEVVIDFVDGSVYGVADSIVM